jgi:hypothetical protein
MSHSILSPLEQASLQIMAALASGLRDDITSLSPGSEEATQLVLSTVDWAVAVASATLNAANANDQRLFQNN